MPINQGGHQIIGGRKSQEDFFAISTPEQVMGFNLLSPEQQQWTFSKTIEEMQKQSAQDACGTTLCSAVAWTEGNGSKRKLKTSCANVGDSMAYLIIINEQNEVSIKMLNQLHKPDPVINPHEFNRVWAAIGLQPRIPIEDGSTLYRLPFSGINMSRSIGDTHHEQYGLIHTPEISFTEEPFLEGGRAFILVASDGLDKLSQEKITEIIFEKKNNLSEAAITLVVEASEAAELDMELRCQQAGQEKTELVSDNTSVVLFEVNAQPISALMLDGHSGDSVARRIERNFYPDFQKKIQMAKNVQIPVDTSIKQATIKGIQEYIDWQAGRIGKFKNRMTPEEYEKNNQFRNRRGNDSCLTKLRHSKKWFSNQPSDAEALLAMLVATNNQTNAQTMILLEQFFTNCRTYNNHSASSFLLDHLRTLPDSIFGKAIIPKEIEDNGIWKSGARYQKEKIIEFVQSSEFKLALK